MAIFVHLVNLAQWRWSSSVGLVLVACVPIAAATLFIPNEIEAPWGVLASSAIPRSVAERTTRSERADAALGGEPAVVAQGTPSFDDDGDGRAQGGANAHRVHATKRRAFRAARGNRRRACPRNA